jgi:regulator of cell morphogenesis and NO signaling
MTESLAAELEREHREIDHAIAMFASSDGSGPHDREPLRRAISVLRRHIYVEEERVFPGLREAGLFAPVLVMLREHGQIWNDLDRIERDLDADPAATPNLCHQLLIRLQHHNAKEERIIYPATDEALSALEAAELASFLDGGNLPAGWICAKASATR